MPYWTVWGVVYMKVGTLGALTLLCLYSGVTIGFFVFLVGWVKAQVEPAGWVDRAFWLQRLKT